LRCHCCLLLSWVEW